MAWKNQKLDLIGQTFSYLTVLEKTGTSNLGKSTFLCQCICGNKVNVVGSNLKSGNTKSCGCKTKELNRLKKLKSLQGEKIGKLFVKKYNEQISILKGEACWDCICDCKNLTTVRGSDLKRGRTKSCGSCVKSYGEQLISTLLKDKNINFILNFRDSNCNLTTGGIAIFDFAVINDSKEPIYFIEFDGEQHFLEEERGFYTEDILNKIKQRDYEKNQHCLLNKIPLIRIPYYHDNITIDDLLLITSQFLLEK